MVGNASPAARPAMLEQESVCSGLWGAAPTWGTPLLRSAPLQPITGAFAVSNKHEKLRRSWAVELSTRGTDGR